MLRIKSLTKNLGGRLILDEIDFTLVGNTKVALIGPNGCGKTTLFKILLDEVEPDAGQVIVQNEKIGYLPQELEFPADETYQDFLDALMANSAEQWRVKKILDKLELTGIRSSDLTTNLSEGQKMKLKLAETLVDEPTVLLLDEPTNHLDIEGLLWFEKFIQQFKGMVLMISHDRAFLDNTVDTIFEIDEKKIHIFIGNYTAYKNQKEGWIERRDQAYKEQERKRKQLEQLIENARKIKDGKKRGKAIRAAEKRMEREVAENEMAVYQRYGIKGMQIEGETHRAKLMLTVKDLAMQFGNKPIFHDLSFEIRGYQRVWLYGPNGAGKTTLLNIITQGLKPTGGEIKLGENVKWGYFRQNQEHLPKDVTVGDYLMSRGFGGQTVYGFLSKLNFSKDYLIQPLGNLSPGERARLSFGIFTTEEYNFLILDEPSNHLDIWTKEVIEKSLQDFKGAVLLVSHDRYFVKNIGVDQVLNLKDGELNFVENPVE
jgi:ATPase subunit of ABC transporter with duplicated ATPase domains